MNILVLMQQKFHLWKELHVDSADWDCITWELSN